METTSIPTLLNIQQIADLSGASFHQVKALVVLGKIRPVARLANDRPLFDPGAVALIKQLIAEQKD